MEPLKVSEQAKVGIVGAGLMGHAIAQVFAANSFSVLLFDSNRQVLEAAPDRIRANFSAFLDLGLATPDDVDRTLSLVRLCPDLEEATSDAEVVVEAVSENLPLKQKIFAELEGYVQAGGDSLLQYVRNQYQPDCRTAGKKRTTRRNALLESAAYCSLCGSNQIALHV